MTTVAGQAPLVLAGGTAAAITGLPLDTPDEHAVFLRIDPPPSAAPGATYGASSYAVVVTKEI